MAALEIEAFYVLYLGLLDFKSEVVLDAVDAESVETGGDSDEGCGLLIANSTLAYLHFYDVIGVV